VRFTKGAAIFVLLFYIFLWVLALHGVSSLIPVLVVPVVLAALVAFGVWLNRFMGVTPRRQHFTDPVEPVAAKDATQDIVEETGEDTGDRRASEDDHVRGATAPTHTTVEPDESGTLE
jgi:hypothetical protein